MPVTLDPDVLCDFALTKELVNWRSTSTGNDDLLKTWINGVCDLIHVYCGGRQFVKDTNPKTLRYVIDRDDLDEDGVMIDDLSALTSIDVVLRDGSHVQSVDLALVEKRTHTRRRGWPIIELGFIPGFANSTMLVPGYAIDVTGTWGWPAIPETVTNFAMQTAAAWCTRDLSKFSASFRLDQGRVEIPRVLPDTVRAGLRMFRRYPVGGVQVGLETS